MSSVPIALWNLKVPSGGVKVPGYDDEDGSPLPYRITMAAIDSSTQSSKPSTLKLHKRVVAITAESDDEDEDEQMDDGESVEEEYVICTLESGKVIASVPWIALIFRRPTSKFWISPCLRMTRSTSLFRVTCISLHCLG